MELIPYFLIGFATGMVNGVASGGGLVAIPSLLFLGVSPITTVATTKLSAIGSAASALVKFHKEKVIQWQYVPQLIAIAITAGIIGPRIVINIDENTIETVIAIILLVLAPFLLLHKTLGVISTKHHRKRIAAGLFAYLLTIMYGAMFGAGGGIFMAMVLMYFFGMNTVQANATLKVPGLIGLSVALTNYALAGYVDFSIGIPLFAGSLCGGYLGAKIAIKKGSSWVKIALAVIMIASGLRLLLL